VADELIDHLKESLFQAGYEPKEDFGDSCPGDPMRRLFEVVGEGGHADVNLTDDAIEIHDNDGFSAVCLQDPDCVAKVFDQMRKTTPRLTPPGLAKTFESDQDS
jgi:hypothetical protein